MALIAVHAVVHISSDALVVLIRLGFRVAIGALENRVVIRIRVARRAHAVGVAMVDRERRVLRVIEGRILPVRGVVAVLARRREKLRLGRVPRIRGVVVIALMAADAGRRQRGVVIVDVAVGAGPRGHRVRSRQWKGRVVVIESRIRPGSRVMAKLASRREAGMRHGTVCPGEIGLVARNAERAVQLVVVVDVAIRARPWGHGVRTGQWEAGLRVIEFGIRPLHGVMTLLASRRETRVRYRASRVVEILLMARNASRVRDVVVGGAMAVRARPWGHGVRTGQWERGFGVVKRCRLPR